MFQDRPGLMSLLKQGGKHFTGLEEAVFRNIDACRKLSAITLTSFGPGCMNKLVVSHIEKLFVTSDASTIVEQLEVQHPAAKLIVFATQMQDQEYGDATNFVVVLAGELLGQAEVLLREGLHTADVIKGYAAAASKAVELLDLQGKPLDLKDVGAMKTAISTAIGTKAMLQQNSKLCDLICEACAFVTGAGGGKVAKPLHLDNVRVAKLTGGSLDQSQVVQGMVVLRDCQGTVKQQDDCKVMVLGCGLEHSSTEAKGTVLLHSADELLNYTAGEEKRMEAIISSIAEAGVKAIVVGGNVADVALHFCNKLGILVLKVTSKFELQRLSRTLGAMTLLKLAAPGPDECGYAESIQAQELASQIVTIVKSRDSKVATLLLRGATSALLDELERTVSDGVRCVRNLQSDCRVVPGAGATELATSQTLAKWAKTLEGLQQYAALAFAESLEVIPKAIADNNGLRGTEIVASLHAAHAAGNSTVGVDVNAVSGTGVADSVDVLAPKRSALRLAADAVLTVLQVDEIIMARPAGGPKAPQQRGDWDQD